MSKLFALLAIRPLAGLAAMLALMPSGCGGQVGEVSGTVRLNGKAVSRGLITFESQEKPGLRLSGSIAEDGRYKLTGCPSGPMRITCKTAVPHGGRQDLVTGNPGARKAGPQAIPNRYSNPDTSGLEYLVRPGPQEYDLDLMP